MPNTSSQSAACLESCSWEKGEETSRRGFGLLKNLPQWNGLGEEGAWPEWIGAARSQPGSFIEIFLNNFASVSFVCQQCSVWFSDAHRRASPEFGEEMFCPLSPG